MKYLLDTNICIYIIQNRPLSVKEKFITIGTDQLHVSSITVAELDYGVAKSEQIEKNSKVLKEFLQRLTIADFDLKAANEYGSIRRKLEKKGKPVGAHDMLIACIAKSLNFTLVTNNEKEFTRIDDLQIENWVR